jgi:hypothetical protein
MFVEGFVSGSGEEMRRGLSKTILKNRFFCS